MKKQNLLLVMLGVLLASSLYFSCKKEPVPTLTDAEIQQEMFARLDAGYNELVALRASTGVVSDRACGSSARVKVVVGKSLSPLAVTIRNPCGTLVGSYNAPGTYYLCAEPGATLDMAGTGNPGSSFTVKLNRDGWCAPCSPGGGPGPIPGCVGPVTTITVTTPSTPPYLPTFGTYNVTGCEIECE